MRTIALRRLAELNPPAPAFDALPHDAEVLFLPLETVWADGRADQTRRAAKSAVSSGYTRFHAGDIVSPKVTPTFQAARTMIAAAVGAGTTELHILRARDGVDPRWIAYALRSNHYLAEGVTAFQGVAGLQRVPEDFVAEFRIADVDREEQRRIADFLDDRVARIDQIIAARQAQTRATTGLAEKAFTVAFAKHVREGTDLLRALDASEPLKGPDVPVLPLGRVLKQLTNGYVGPTRDILVESGIRYIQGTHIKDGRIQFARRPFYVSKEWHAAHPRIALRAGDILLVQTGDLGQVAEVPADFGPASCHALLIARVNDDLLLSSYLTAFLRSDVGQRILLSRASGALHPHLEFGIKDAPVPVPDSRVQAAVSYEVAEQSEGRRNLVGLLRVSIQRLHEYKQSLITAAVTGEFDVTTASTRIPE